MRRSTMVSTCVAMIVAALPMASSVAAVAPASPGADQAALAAALDLPPGFGVTFDGDPAAIGTQSRAFDDFPARGSSYAVLSTGRAADIFDPNVPNGQPSTDLGAPGPDVSMLRFDVPAADGCLLVDLAMGTEERVATYTPSTPSDAVSLRRAGAATEYAMHPGGQYFSQKSKAADPVQLSVNAISYWHRPDDPDDRTAGPADIPWLVVEPATPGGPNGVTTFDHFTSVETYEVPLDGQSTTVELSVADALNGLMDTVVLVDHVRVAPHCSTDSAASTGVATNGLEIDGHRGVGNTLWVDLVPQSDDELGVESYRAGENGWFAGADRSVDLRFRWYRTSSTNCYSTDISRWTPIANADRQAYVPTNLDKGKCLIVMVTGRKDGFRTETFPSPSAASWNPTLLIQDGAFDGQQPRVEGPEAPAVGDVLSATGVRYVPRPDSLSYTWLADGRVISGQTGSTIKLSSTQAGTSISVRVTAKRSGFVNRTDTSEPLGPVALLEMRATSAPSISGSASSGSVLTAIPGGFDQTPDGHTFQWKIDGEVIRNQTKSTYTVSSEDVGRRITVVVTGTKAGFTPASASSAPVSVLARAMTPVRPTISGSVQPGGTLSASVTGWQPASPSFIYTWKAGATILQSGTSPRLKIPVSAVGKRITVTVEGRKTGYATTSTTSLATATVPKAALSKGIARITGRAKVGQTLRARPGAWGPAPVSLSYQWYADGKVIKAATRSTYRLPVSSRGKRITIKVTGKKTGYATATTTSPRTARVAR